MSRKRNGQKKPFKILKIKTSNSEFVVILFFRILRAKFLYIPIRYNFFNR